MIHVLGGTTAAPAITTATASQSLLAKFSWEVVAGEINEEPQSGDGEVVHLI